MRDEIVLSLGPLNVALRGDAIPLADAYTDLTPFVTDGEADIVADLRFGDRPRCRWSRSELLSASTDERKRVLDVRFAEWEALFDLPGRALQATIHGRWALAVDSLLKTAAQVFALELGCAVLAHGAAVARDGLGYAFLGRSGAGKTTVATISQAIGAQVVAEELLCIGLEGPSPTLVSMPFYQRSGFRVDPVRVPLAGIYWLEQASRDAVSLMTRASQMHACLACVTIGVRQPIVANMGLNAVERLLDVASVRRLQFRKSTDFWDAIDQ